MKFALKLDLKKLVTIALVALAVFFFYSYSHPGYQGYSAFAQNGTSPSQEDLAQITEQWQGSAHAIANINCSSCHLDQETEALISKPDHESCRTCHEQAVATFLLGKHGIRLNEGMTPLTPAMAQIPMKEAAMDKQMTCNTCHDVHSANTTVAAADSCLTCHNDNHSLNYEQSRHAEIFRAKGNIPRPDRESVTCATCHLPRQIPENGDWVHVNHNNTFTLLPRDRMVSEVCMNCHGMEYAYKSIFDDEMVEANFNRSPTLEMETFELVRELEERRSGSPSE
ncbi:doubled CXXCH domain protein [Thalassoporum mexicanum PCC 7367]|uniref:doubled CXXCH domain-containing protein n=1 Tax=Thalassoporum mexicanum TaxID=3457544 RepID=UPI00029F8A6E|nr:doubled CXXCH domain-containing protein [Pseudanabaena sp. PCC 7367]AFY70921.1 doubled CXXCH domain protein [Pseudanabaena sp. PCC 7367]